MSRILPSECDHGTIYDWGDFGGPDTKPEVCEHGCNADALADSGFTYFDQADEAYELVRDIADGLYA